MISVYLQSQLEQKQGHKNKCENYAKIRQGTQQYLNDPIVVIEDLNWKSVINGFNSLDNSIRNYIDEKSGTSNQARYEQGKLLYLVASILEPNGKTGIRSLIANTKNSIQALPKITTKIDSRSLITKLQQETRQKN
ncbi:hypothetical protein BWI97_17510 [Siphonobacter sp. BAB-5405]|nr:hypothetical protein BWI97_17510 [Siphonobacter sp. BAB-5405]